jgi:hypothetical protein
MSRIIDEMYEIAESHYKIGTMSKEVFLEFKKIYDDNIAEQKRGNKVSKK